VSTENPGNEIQVRPQVSPENETFEIQLTPEVSTENPEDENQLNTGCSAEKTETTNGRVKGTDGKTYKPKKTEKAKKAAAEGAAAARALRLVTEEQDDPPEEVQPEDLLDQNGQQLPAQAVAAFEMVPTINEWVRDLHRIVLQIKKLDKSSFADHLHVPTVTTQIRGVIKTLKGARPAYVCPYCGGDGRPCDACHGNAWVTAMQYDMRPEAQEAEGRR
jgi:hypothetical protein